MTLCSCRRVTFRGRIAGWLAVRGEAVPAGPAETVRCIVDSLALAYRRAIAEAQSLSGRHADVVHVVGGGARNELLCQLTADATGLPVIAGPAEATCFGNVLVQARALGAAPGDLAGMRALIRSTQPLRSFTPPATAAGPGQRPPPGSDRVNIRPGRVVLLTSIHDTKDTARCQKPKSPRRPGGTARSSSAASLAWRLRGDRWRRARRVRPVRGSAHT